jgi:hypothetical protein
LNLGRRYNPLEEEVITVDFSYLSALSDGHLKDSQLYCRREESIAILSSAAQSVTDLRTDVTSQVYLPGVAKVIGYVIHST